MTITNADLSVLTEETVGGLRVEPVTETAKWINILIYGFSGVGKTVLAGSASDVPEMSPVLILNLEGGTLSLKKTYPKVKAVSINTWAELQAVYDDIIAGKTKYKTVVLDSISEFQRLSMHSIMHATVVNDTGQATLDKSHEWGTSVKEKERNIFVPAQREWGINLGQMRKMVRAFRDAPVNTIFTALATQQPDKRTGVWTNKPSLQGQSGNELPGFLDEVFYLYITRDGETLTRRLLTQQTDTTIAKDRSGMLPITIEIPDAKVAPGMKIIYEMITGKEPVNV